MNYRFSRHAEEEMARRGISVEMVRALLAAPQQVADDPSGCKVCQSQVDFGTGKPYLLRVFVNEAVSAALVVTVYRTSKIAKYWRAQ
jgi:hypothetical protein